ncbi:transcriptional regulator [Lactobacillus crispatus]|nr:helix-turn-helix transcriptional regulator [Lactobacillus crispatus]QYA51788.1 helix-turn-helix transcriptional regulator [Lactobacillus crispatus 2029]TDM69847.1 transcriptional regulator [Lactobacillus crispatus]TDM72730.1 transcriptional regulator [Lactobacillus crispatus]
MIKKGGEQMTQFTKSNSSEILKKYLDSHGIKNKYLAEKMGIPPSTLSYYLNGHGKFTVDFAFAVSSALGISPEIFLDKSYKKLVTNKRGD